MKTAFTGLGVLMVCLICLALCLLFGDVTATNQHDYVLMKSTNESAMIDAIDYAKYRRGFCICTDRSNFEFTNKNQYEILDLDANDNCIDNTKKHCQKLYGAYVINKTTYAESFIRKFANSVADNHDYNIVFQDIIEYPPKVSVEVQSNNIHMLGVDDNISVLNTIDSIIESNIIDGKNTTTGTLNAKVSGNWDNIDLRLLKNDKEVNINWNSSYFNPNEMALEEGKYKIKVDLNSTFKSLEEVKINNKNDKNYDTNKNTTSEFSIESGKKTDVEIKISEQGKLIVSVVDEDNKPLSGAKVAVGDDSFTSGKSAYTIWLKDGEYNYKEIEFPKDYQCEGNCNGTIKVPSGKETNLVIKNKLVPPPDDTEVISTDGGKVSGSNTCNTFWFEARVSFYSASEKKSCASNYCDSVEDCLKEKCDGVYISGQQQCRTSNKYSCTKDYDTCVEENGCNGFIGSNNSSFGTKQIHGDFFTSNNTGDMLAYANGKKSSILDNFNRTSIIEASSCGVSNIIPYPTYYIELTGINGNSDASYGRYKSFDIARAECNDYLNPKNGKERKYKSCRVKCG